MAKPPVVFIHGLWLHGSSWEPWMALFADNGYQPLNPPWPGDAPTVEASRANPEAIANHGVMEVADSYADVIKTLPAPPILIGHSFGGILVQELLGSGIAAAGIAIDPAPIKGVWQLPFSALKSSFPVLDNPANFTKAVSLTFEEFQYAFANAIPEEEARELYDRYTIPAPGKPLFQAATATFNPHSETKANVDNETRGPLLLISGASDHTVPPVIVEATLALYKHSPAVTELQSFPNRGHSLPIDHGWKELADYSLSWLGKHGL